MTAKNALYPVAEIRGIEQAAQAGLPPGTLMQRAGQAAAETALQLISGSQSGNRVLVLAGPGNNGGDALEVASHLARAGWQVSVLLYADPAKQSADAQLALQRAKLSTSYFADPSGMSSLALTAWALVVDGLFGIGLQRPISGELRALVEIVNTLPCPVLALDIPSGLDADTGAVVGKDGIAVIATHTITFIADKPGLHTCDGRDYAGDVRVAALEIDANLFPPPRARLNHAELFSHSLHRRPHNSHKGTYGDVAVIGGAHGMGGAPILAARAAAQCGAGRVYAAFIEAPPAYDSTQPELMCRFAHELDFASATLVVGPGLGTSRAAHDLLIKALGTGAPLVLDADALNLVSTESGLKQKLRQRTDGALLTPHPLEAARLLGTAAAHIQADRVAAARTLAAEFNAVIILKGSGTVIARPDGEIVINTTGNPALATAGTGDVLAGMCGALLAQQWRAWEAALCAVWLHGLAADMLVEQGTGPVGVIAGELIPVARKALNQLIEQHAHAAHRPSR
jgi:hydroxyethylthiazole kinase-like uncharacterized protein yjeF